MSQNTAHLKDEILAELRQDLAGRGRAVHYVNVALLVLLGLSVGFLIGRRYERTLQGVAPQRSFLAAGAGQAPGGGEMPADHPDLASAEAQNAMAPILALRARLEENPEDLEALIMLGNLNFEIGRMEAAVDYYQRSLAISPGDPDVITDMGIAYRRMERPNDALEAFNLAASLDDTHWQSRLNRGVVLMMDIHDTAGAIQAFEEYLALGPDVPNHAAVRQQVELLRQEGAGEARLHGEPAGGPSAPPS